ncbi:hypothetical protein ACIOKD_05985 [Streptomyces sp. NPDC087844]|uniref:hypothetical protein n=1 Tax=Streptomyces sp. NPDC087844 TaxID=3365805 RepID=UPI0037F5D21B
MGACGIRRAGRWGRAAQFPAPLRAGTPCLAPTGREVHSDPCKDRYQAKDSYIFGDAVPFGSWTVETGAFRRYGNAGDSVS